MANNELKTEITQIKTDEIYENASDNLIMITESKAKLVYHKYIESSTKGAILTNIGLAVAFLTPVFTADFKSILGISASVVEAVFILASLLFCFKAITSVIYVIKIGRFLKEENFILELKGYGAQGEKDNEEITRALRHAYLRGLINGRKGKKY